MKLSTYFAPTLKEDPKDAEVVSHRLLLRAGFIRKVAAGIYDFLPLGIRSLRRIETIVRQEMDRTGAMEILMPAVQPAEIWKESGRWEYYGPELLRMKDRKGGEFCLGPTHEEVVTALVRGELRSYRQMPINLYQIQTKFRDEVRPRAGLMRGREFIMKDAYSFDADEEAAKRSYQIMYDAYCRIFDRIGLRYRPVEADTGNIGGNLSHEFQVLADSGEDNIVSCPSCGYTANVEKAELGAGVDTVATGTSAMELVETPGVGTIDAVARFFGVPASQTVKSLLFDADGTPVLACIQGDLELNEIKLKSHLGATTLHLASDQMVRERLGCAPGSVGPAGVQGVRVVLDRGVDSIADAIVGAGRDGAHLRGFNAVNDCPTAERTDLRIARGGDPCGRCSGSFEFFRGIEVGQVFYLGTKYSTPMRATFLDSQGEEKPFVMGCYGIGVSRILSAAIEQNHDENGLIWPLAIAPFHVIILPLQLKNEALMAAAQGLYDQLRANGVDVLMDDRDQRPGFKFKDADLLGIPIRITLGERSLEAGQVEWKERTSSESTMMGLTDAVELAAQKVRAAVGMG